MLYQTSIPAGTAKEDLVMALVSGIQELTGAKIEMEYMLVVSTDDTDVSTMLDALKDKLANIPAKKSATKAAKEAKAPRKTKAPKAKNEPRRGPHVKSIKILSTGEMISRFELDRRLAGHDIELLSVVHSPKHGDLTVVEAAEVDGPYKLMNKAGDLA